MPGEYSQEKPAKALRRSCTDGREPGENVIAGEVPGSASSLFLWGTLEHGLCLRVCSPWGKRAGLLYFHSDPSLVMCYPDGRAAIGSAPAEQSSEGRRCCWEPRAVEHGEVEERYHVWFKGHIWLRGSGSTLTVPSSETWRWGPSSKRTSRAKVQKNGVWLEEQVQYHSTWKVNRT